MTRVAAITEIKPNQFGSADNRLACLNVPTFTAIRVLVPTYVLISSSSYGE
jgi:hypothetical protein